MNGKFASNHPDLPACDSCLCKTCPQRQTAVRISEMFNEEQIGKLKVAADEMRELDRRITKLEKGAK